MSTNSNVPNKNNIVCRWMEENKFLVNPDRQVWPCCYLANQGYKFRRTGQYKDPEILAVGKDDITHPVMQSYYEVEEELNLKNNSINDILKHEWFTKTLPESWDSDDPHRLCMIVCSKYMDEEY
jgi:hypothetical protein